MGRNRHGSHTVSRLTVRIVCVTKYLYWLLTLSAHEFYGFRIHDTCCSTSSRAFLLNCL